MYTDREEQVAQMEAAVQQAQVDVVRLETELRDAQEETARLRQLQDGLRRQMQVTERKLVKVKL